MPRNQQPFFEGLRLGRFIFWLVAGLFLLVGTLFAWRRTEEFLIKDNHFRIAEPGDGILASPDLLVNGIHYASASQIRQIFAEDFGRSLYLVPIEERRRQLLKIDWVEDAAVSKIWPSSLRVSIRERTPVAFIHLPPRRADGVSQFALIDKDGYILRPRVAARFTLPVISGVRESETLENRRARVRRVLDMLRQIGPLAGQISEINVADPNDLVVAEHVGNSVVNLMLGDDNYSDRLQNFLNSYPEIKARRPDATTLDLRVDGIITAVGEDRR